MKETTMGEGAHVRSCVRACVRSSVMVELGTTAHAFNPSTGEEEAAGSL